MLDTGKFIIIIIIILLSKLWYDDEMWFVYQTVYCFSNSSTEHDAKQLRLQMEEQSRHLQALKDDFEVRVFKLNHLFSEFQRCS